MEINEVIIICPDFKGFRVSFKVMAEEFKGVNDSEEFFIINIIVLFCGEEQFKEVGDRVLIIEEVGLFLDSTHGKIYYNIKHMIGNWSPRSPR
jgi:hypothetical protein